MRWPAILWIFIIFESYDTKVIKENGEMDPTGSPTPPPPPACPCDASGLWLDIILVVDSSNLMTQTGFQSILSYVATVMVRMPISQDAGQHSRLGIVTYSDVATLRYPLTAFKNVNDVLGAVFNLPFENKVGSNIESGLRSAMIEFGQNGYRNRRKVIILVASHYDGSSPDPTQTASVFRGNGGWLITIRYTHSGTTSINIFQKIASPCSYLSNAEHDLRVQNLVDVFCLANCYCASNFYPFAVDDKCGNPIASCYAPTATPMSSAQARSSCRDKNNATLATVCDGPKAVFLASFLTVPQGAQWIGLSRSNDGTFSWDDGTAYEVCSPDQNPKWLNGTAENGQSVAQLVQGFVGGFFGASPTTNYYAMCQNAPCSSGKYCP